MSAPASAWPVTVRIGEVARFTPDAPLHRRLVADESVRRAIARTLDLAALTELEAEIELSGWFDGVRIDGRWTASVIQTCGVTQEDFPTALGGEFVVRAVPEGSRHAVTDAPEVEIDIDADDPPDVLQTDQVDIGAYVVEHLALEIDPYPRKPGAVFTPLEPNVEASPFAALLKLKTGDLQG